MWYILVFDADLEIIPDQRARSRRQLDAPALQLQNRSEAAGEDFVWFRAKGMLVRGVQRKLGGCQAWIDCT